MRNEYYCCIMQVIVAYVWSLINLTFVPIWFSKLYNIVYIEKVSKFVKFELFTINQFDLNILIEWLFIRNTTKSTMNVS